MRYLISLNAVARSTAVAQAALFGFCFGLLLSLQMSLVPNQANADGKLGGVSRAARKSSSKAAPKPQPAQPRPAKALQKDNDRQNEGRLAAARNNAGSRREAERQAEHQDQRDRDRRNRARNRRNRNGGGAVVFFNSAPTNFIGHPMVEPFVTPLVPCGGPVSTVTTTTIIESPQVIHSPIPAPVFQPAPVYQQQPFSLLESANDLALPAPCPDLPCPDLIANDWFQVESSRFWATLGSDFDGISAGSLGLNLQMPGSIGLDAGVSTLRERGMTFRDHLWIGDVNLVYELLSAPRMRARMGVGINWLNDAWGSEAGFNLTAAVDFKLSERWLVTGEGDLGNLGDADFFHAKAALARRFEACDWLVGAEHYNIGGAELNNFFTGIQLRF